MGIPLDPEPRDKVNAVAGALAEAVGPATRDRDHHPVAVSALYYSTESARAALSRGDSRS